MLVNSGMMVDKFGANGNACALLFKRAKTSFGA